jgi:hypothetical protein
VARSWRLTPSNSAACSLVAGPDPRAASCATHGHSHRQARHNRSAPRREWREMYCDGTDFAQGERSTATHGGCADLAQTCSSSFRSGIGLLTKTHTHRGLLRGRSLAARQMHGRGHREGDGPSPGWIGHAVERVRPLRQTVPVPGSVRRQDLLAHLLAQDLAEHRAWHVLDLHDPTRDLVGRE